MKTWFLFGALMLLATRTSAAEEKTFATTFRYRVYVGVTHIDYSENTAIVPVEGSPWRCSTNARSYTADGLHLNGGIFCRIPGVAGSGIGIYASCATTEASSDSGEAYIGAIRMSARCVTVEKHDDIDLAKK